LSKLLQQIRRLFRQENPPQEGFVREALQRSAQETATYREWCARNLEPFRLLLQHRLNASGTEQRHDDFFVLQTPSTRGFILRQPALHFGQRNCPWIFDWLGEAVQRQGYTRQHSDVRSWIRENDVVEQMERRYFKPRFAYDEGRQISDQRYGNILVEHRLLDGQTAEIRLVNNIYHDRAWTEARSFAELRQALFGTEPGPR